ASVSMWSIPTATDSAWWGSRNACWSWAEEFPFSRVRKKGLCCASKFPLLRSSPRERNTVSKIRVLIADDHDIVRAGIRHILAQQLDIEVLDEASDGRSAVMMAERLKPDVVIMDIAMPGLNGIDAAA